MILRIHSLPSMRRREGSKRNQQKKIGSRNSCADAAIHSLVCQPALNICISIVSWPSFLGLTGSEPAVSAKDSMNRKNKKLRCSLTRSTLSVDLSTSGCSRVSILPSVGFPEAKKLAAGRPHTHLDRNRLAQVSWSHGLSSSRSDFARVDSVEAVDFGEERLRIFLATRSGEATTLPPRQHWSIHA
ncbi:hypothetical protein VTO42DRAFT_6604 [Malbranchea cinnamomea]